METGPLRKIDAGKAEDEKLVDEVAGWFDRRTFAPLNPDPRALCESKESARVRVAVCLPARDEEATIGGICRIVRDELMTRWPLVDELIVVDSGSRDATAAEAYRGGAKVYRGEAILPRTGSYPGKGEALWKSLAVTTSDVVLWLDSDITNFSPHFVTRLLAPLLLDPEILFVKGFYDRPVGAERGWMGGRVTELFVRPFVNVLVPELRGVVQPLSGEYGGRREVLLQLPFVTGYGVEMGLLMDLVEGFGLDSLAQSDLGTREHRGRDTLALGKTSHEILLTMLERLQRAGRIDLKGSKGRELLQFTLEDWGPRPEGFNPELYERPPMQDVLEGETSEPLVEPESLG